MVVCQDKGLWDPGEVSRWKTFGKIVSRKIKFLFKKCQLKDKIKFTDSALDQAVQAHRLAGLPSVGLEIPRCLLSVPRPATGPHPGLQKALAMAQIMSSLTFLPLYN